MCSACYTAGHEGCLKAELLDGYAFCEACLPWAVMQRSKLTSEDQKVTWKNRLAKQLAGWQEMSITASGTMATVGVAVGAATVTVAESAAALVQGAVQGVRATKMSSESATATPPAIQDEGVATRIRPGFLQQEVEDQSSSTGGRLPARGRDAPGCSIVTGGTTERRRARSHEEVGLSSRRDSPRVVPHCIACHTANPGHVAHNNCGDCIRVPGRSLYGQPEPVRGRAEAERNHPGPPGSFESLPEQASPDPGDIPDSPFTVALNNAFIASPGRDSTLTAPCRQNLPYFGTQATGTDSDMSSFSLQVPVTLEQVASMVRDIQTQLQQTSQASATRLDTIEHTLTNLQVQHADLAAEVGAVRDRVAHMETEWAEWQQQTHG